MLQCTTSAPAEDMRRALMCFLFCRLVRERSSALRAPSPSPACAACPYARRAILALAANLRHMALITCCASSSCTWAVHQLAGMVHLTTSNSLVRIPWSTNQLNYHGDHRGLIVNSGVFW